MKRNQLWLAALFLLIAGMGISPVCGEDDEDDGEYTRRELRDFIGGVYRGGGTYITASSTASGGGGDIQKVGSVFFTPRGQYQKVGSVYLTPDGDIVTRAGRAFISRDDIRVRAGSAYIEKDGITTSAGGAVFRPSWSSR